MTVIGFIVRESAYRIGTETSYRTHKLGIYTSHGLVWPRDSLRWFQLISNRTVILQNMRKCWLVVVPDWSSQSVREDETQKHFQSVIKLLWDTWWVIPCQVNRPWPLSPTILTKMETKTLVYLSSMVLNRLTKYSFSLEFLMFSKNSYFKLEAISGGEIQIMYLKIESF